MRLFCVALAVVGVSVHAQAAVPDYCAAFARDYADRVTSTSATWQPRYDKAEKSCLFQYTQIDDAEAAPPKAKPAQLKKIAAPQVKKTLLTPEEKPQEQAAAAPAEKPVLGTPAWKAYCARKYVSFNPDKGTYQSKTGVERPCLVTSDFK